MASIDIAHHSTNEDVFVLRNVFNSNLDLPKLIFLLTMGPTSIYIEAAPIQSSLEDLSNTHISCFASLKLKPREDDKDLAPSKICVQFMGLSLTRDVDDIRSSGHTSNITGSTNPDIPDKPLICTTLAISSHSAPMILQHTPCRVNDEHCYLKSIELQLAVCYESNDNCVRSHATWLFATKVPFIGMQCHSNASGLSRTLEWLQPEVRELDLLTVERVVRASYPEFAYLYWSQNIDRYSTDCPLAIPAHMAMLLSTICTNTDPGLLKEEFNLLPMAYVTHLLDTLILKISDTLHLPPNTSAVDFLNAWCHLRGFESYDGLDMGFINQIIEIHPCFNFDRLNAHKLDPDLFIRCDSLIHDHIWQIQGHLNTIPRCVFFPPDSTYIKLTQQQNLAYVFHPIYAHAITIAAMAMITTTPSLCKRLLYLLSETTIQISGRSHVIFVVKPPMSLYLYNIIEAKHVTRITDNNGSSITVQI